MEEEVKRAAREGDIDAFDRVLEREPLVLKQIDEIEFVETPLHTAAYAGCTDLAIEMLSLKPSFGRKLNPGGYSPLDLALRNGHRDTVKQLIKFDPKLIQFRSRERKTPLHFVAENNDVDLLSEFLIACPTAIKELTIRGETAVHLAVISGSIQAFKVLIGWLFRTDNDDILDWKDNNGSTVLHIAAQTSQVEVIKHVAKERVDLDVRNEQNRTAS
ncbi:ankyrin repeat-containing protein BDA1-like [Lycium barbarum]|uniref:ankyrin repeat-containing protein BDA1-like n=1 Tax=Lycium barbarum TaxID=112863 RepID=UPI00293F25C7|nr:ankyrin repeat-containing protein BDA1-like [Lycium barbarum]